SDSLFVRSIFLNIGSATSHTGGDAPTCLRPTATRAVAMSKKHIPSLETARKQRHDGRPHPPSHPTEETPSYMKDPYKKEHPAHLENSANSATSRPRVFIDISDSVYGEVFKTPPPPPPPEIIEISSANSSPSRSWAIIK
ncbi:hypothetical protein V2J09_017364, partial [Rumex salicifolius]